MAYSIDALTEDCYPGTTCLINKLGIQDEEKLAETEAAIVLGKASLLDQQVHLILHITNLSIIFCFAISTIGQGRYVRSTFQKRERFLFLLLRFRRVQMRVFLG